MVFLSNKSGSPALSVGKVARNGRGTGLQCPSVRAATPDNQSPTGRRTFITPSSSSSSNLPFTLVFFSFSSRRRTTLVDDADSRPRHLRHCFPLFFFSTGSSRPPLWPCSNEGQDRLRVKRDIPTRTTFGGVEVCCGVVNDPV